MKSLYKTILLFCALIFIVAFFFKDRYPESSGILQQLHDPPLQSETSADEFTTTVKGVTYTVTPKYEYELYGMVVSFHDSDSYNDYAHKQWKDALNIKDLCLLWGDNLNNNLYKKFDFLNMNWTCFYETHDRDAWLAFRKDEFSNNHLITDDVKLKKAVMKAKKGDQIYIKGFLANYSHGDWFKRSTSNTREDEGQGACEVIFVTDFKIIKKANEFWRLSFLISGVLSALLSMLGIFAFFSSDPRKNS